MTRFKKTLSFMLAFALTVQLAYLSAPATADADTGGATAPNRYVSTVPTPQNSTLINPNYDRSYDNYVVSSDNGIVHPGILQSREDLNTMRDMVWLGKEPWASAFDSFRDSPYTSLSYRSDGPFEIINSEREYYPLTRDATAAYNKALMWYITGSEEYLEQTKDLINSWSGALQADNKKDQIRAGTAIHKFAAAAEILRYTPSSGWGSKEEISNFNRFLDLFKPSVDRPAAFMNQGSIALMAYIGIAVFQDDYSMYEKAVERLAYNKEGGVSNGNSINFSIDSQILNSGQVVEMGRDQGHAHGDFGALGAVARTTYVQGTKVDAKGNIVKFGGRDLYEYANQKLLKGLSYLASYNIGEDVEFEPHVDGHGKRTEYGIVNPDVRGNTDAVYASIYNHYRYVKGYGSDQTRADDTVGSGTYGDFYAPIETMMNYRGLEGTTVDFPGNGELLFTPAAAAKSDPPQGPPQLREPALDNFDKYNRYEASQFTASGGGNGGAVTEPLQDEDGVTRFITSDVNNNEWIAYTIDFDRYESTEANPVDTFIVHYGMNSVTGADVQLRVGPYVERPTSETFNESELIQQFHLDNTGWFTDMKTAVQDLPQNNGQLTGQKTVYFHFINSANVYNYHTDFMWFKFAHGSNRNQTKANEADIRSDAGYAVNGEGHAVLSDGGYFGYSSLDFDNGMQNFVTRVQSSGGELKLYAGQPGEGTLIKTYTLQDSGGAATIVTFSHEESEQLYGKQSIYFVYEGQQELIVDYVAFSAKVKTFASNPGGSFLHVVSGSAERPEGITGAAELMLTGGETTVTYNDVPFLTGPDTLAVKIKSDTDFKLVFDALSLDGGIGPGRIAEFDVKNTSTLAEDGWVTLYADLSKSGFNKKTGQPLISVTAIGGDGTVEIAYFQFNPDNLAPELSVSDANGGVPAELTVLEGEQITWKLQASDSDGLTSEIREYSIPEAAVYTQNSASAATFSFDTNGKQGSHEISFAYSDDQTTLVRTIVVHVLTPTEFIDGIIEQSGIDRDLTTLFVYQREQYDSYVTIKDQAYAEPNEANIAALEQEIQNAKEKLPVLSKIRFKLRTRYSQGHTEYQGKDALSVYLDGTENVNSGSRIATTGTYGTALNDSGNWGQSPLTVTDWIPFATEDGEPLKADDLHQLKLTWGYPVNLSWFEVASEDDSYVQRVEAISASQRSTNLRVEKTGGVGAADPEYNLSFTGGGSWAVYTNAPFNMNEFTFTSATLFPNLNVFGLGYPFVVQPDIVTALKDAEPYLERESDYTSASFLPLEDVYMRAKRLAEELIVGSEVLTEVVSKNYADEIRQAISDLVIANHAPEAEIQADEENEEVTADFAKTGAASAASTEASAQSPNRSDNPSFTTTRGSTLSFLIDTADLDGDDLAIGVASLGYRGSAGNSAIDLASIINPIVDHGAVIEETDDPGVYRFAWTAERAGNYRAIITVSDGKATASRAVELVFRHDVALEIAPDYVRLRYAGPNKPTMNVIVGSETIPVDIPASGGWTTYINSEWIALPSIDSGVQTVQIEVVSSAVNLDFIEFATSSYANAFPVARYETSPSSSGVKRIEAEHFDWRTGISGGHGFEFNNSGVGSMNVSNIGNNYRYEYRNIALKSKEGYVPTTSIEATLDSTMIGKGQTAQITGEVLPPNATMQLIGYATSDPLIATVSRTGLVTANGAGTAVISLLAADTTETITIHVYDSDELRSQLAIYDQYLAGLEEEYTVASWSLLQAKVTAAQDVLANQANNGEAIMTATKELAQAIQELVNAADLTTLRAYQTQAGLLDEEDYTTASWDVLRAAIEAAELFTSQSEQQAVNRAAQQLQNAIMALMPRDDQPTIPLVSLTGPETAVPGDTVTLTIGVQGMDYNEESGFNTFEAVVHYDPARIQFADVVNDNDTETTEDDYFSLAPEAYTVLDNRLQLIGSPIKKDEGEILLLLVSVSETVTDGDLLELHGSIGSGAAPGTTKVSILEANVGVDGDKHVLEHNAASVSVNVQATDKTALSTLIADAMSLHANAVAGSRPGQYPQSAKDAFWTAIEAAESVESKTDASLSEINAALQALTTAIETFRNTVNQESSPVITYPSVDKSGLASLIQKAQERHDSVTEGGKVGNYKQGAKAKLKAAIEAAQAVHRNAAATQAQVDAAIQAMQDAVSSFSGSIISLVEGATAITTHDLSIIAKYYGATRDDKDAWAVVGKADMNDTGEISIETVAAIAKMIVVSWVEE